MRSLATLYILLIFSAFTIAYTLAYPKIAEGKWDDFWRIATVGITAVSSLMAAITSLSVMKRQAAATRKLQTLEAYRELYGAAHEYYRALAPLETGDWDIQRVRESEERMVKAGNYLFYLHQKKEDRKIWRSFWQRARAIAEETNKNGKDSEFRKQLWMKHVGHFGGLLNQFEKAAASQLEGE